MTKNPSSNKDNETSTIIGDDNAIPDAKKLGRDMQKVRADIKNKMLSDLQAEHSYQIVQIDIEKIIPFKGQQRTQFPEDLIRALAETIKKCGIQDPLKLLPIEDGMYEVISGERRLRAAKLLGLKEVPAILQSDEMKAEVGSLLTNIQREDLHPIEIGRAYKRLMKILGFNYFQQLSKIIGVPNKEISEYVSYTKIPDDVCMDLIKNDIRARNRLRLELQKVQGKTNTSQVIDTKKIFSTISNNVRKQFQVVPVDERESFISELEILIDELRSI